MPIAGSFSTTLDIYSRSQYKTENQWNTGSLTTIQAKKMFNISQWAYNAYDSLVLGQWGSDIIYYEHTQTDFNFCASQSNVTFHPDGGNVGDGYLKLTLNQSSGYRQIQFDLSEVNKWGIAYLSWYSGSHGAPTIKVSIDNINWETVSSQMGYSEPGYVSGWYTIRDILNPLDDVSNKILYIRQEFTDSTSELHSFQLHIRSAYHTSGIWQSQKIPLSDLGISSIVGGNGWSTSGLSSCLFKVSVNNGSTWRTITPYQEILTTSELTAKSYILKIEMSTNNFVDTPIFNYIESYYWARLFTNEIVFKENVSDKIPEINFKTLVTQTDATWMHLVGENSFNKTIRLTQTNDAVSKTFLGIIMAKPRVTKLLTQEYIDVKCYDAKYLAQRILLNDSTPKGMYYHGGSFVSGNTLAQSVANLWRIYGPSSVYCEGSNNRIYPYDALQAGAIYMDDRVLVKKTGTSFGTLFDFMNEICDDDEYEWSLIENTTGAHYTGSDNVYPIYMLKVVPKTSGVIQPITLSSVTNIVGIPNVSQDDDMSEIANVVTVPTRVRKVNYEQVMNLKANVQIYYFQYTPIARNFSLSDGSKVWLDPHPVVYLKVGGNWIAKETVEDTTTQTNPTPEVHYNIEQKWIKLLTNPTADVIEGIKIIYTVQIPSAVILRDEDSIALYGEIQHYISGDYDRNEAYQAGDKYLFEHAFPISPVSLETTQWKYNIGDYLTVYIPEQGINQLMPVIEKKTTVNGPLVKVELILNKAPTQDEQMIVDIFNRIKMVERRTDKVGDSPDSIFKNVNEKLGLKERVLINKSKGWYL